MLSRGWKRYHESISPRLLVRLVALQHALGRGSQRATHSVRSSMNSGNRRRSSSASGETLAAPVLPLEQWDQQSQQHHALGRVSIVTYIRPGISHASRAGPAIRGPLQVRAAVLGVVDPVDIVEASGARCACTAGEQIEVLLGHLRGRVGHAVVQRDVGAGRLDLADPGFEVALAGRQAEADIRPVATDRVGDRRACRLQNPPSVDRSCRYMNVPRAVRQTCVHQAGAKPALVRVDDFSGRLREAPSGTTSRGHAAQETSDAGTQHRREGHHAVVAKVNVSAAPPAWSSLELSRCARRPHRLARRTGARAKRSSGTPPTRPTPR